MYWTCFIVKMWNGNKFDWFPFLTFSNIIFALFRKERKPYIFYYLSYVISG